MHFILTTPDRSNQYNHKAMSASITSSKLRRYESRIEFMVGPVVKRFVRSNLGHHFNSLTWQFTTFDNASKTFVGKDWDDPHHVSAHQSSYCSSCTHNPKTSRSQPIIGLKS